jgi:hypothetical protein
MRLFLLICSIGLAFALYAQEGRLANFTVSQLDRSNVQISWTMKAGVSCQSPEVQRSSDSLKFNSIYRYPGVCGGGNEQETYSWIDSRAIKGKKSYYRLKIDEGEFSRIAAIEAGFDFSVFPIRVYPQPCTHTLNLAYAEELGKVENVRIYNSNGNEFGVVTLSSSSDQLLRLSTTKLPAGVYFLWLDFKEKQSRKVKFVKID